MMDSVFPPALISWFAIIGMCWTILALGVVIEWIAERIVDVWAARSRGWQAEKDVSRRQGDRAARLPWRLE